MKKNIFKIIVISMIFILSCYSTTTVVYADWFQGASEFADGELDETVITIDEENVKNTSNFISGLLLGIAVIVAVITTALLGLNFIIESAEGKAKIKEALVPLIVGMVISFGAYIIWKFAVNLLFK